MKITTKSFLGPLHGKVEGYNKYTAKDKKYMITAIPVTTSKFGPSGSLKNKNIARENKIAVTPRITNEIFFMSYFFKT